MVGHQIRPSGPRFKKGTPRTLNGEALEEFRKLWAESDLSPNQIAEVMKEQFGFETTVDRLVWQARREGLNRWGVKQGIRSKSLIEQDLLEKAWKRWAEPKPPVDRVVKVESKTFPVPTGGYRMGQK